MVKINSAINVTESPIKWCSVSLSETLERGKRLEASVFDVEAKQAREYIMANKYPIRHLCGNDGLCYAYVRGRFKRIWAERSDFPIYQPSSINDIYPKPEGYLSHNTQTDIESLRVHKIF